MHLVHWFMICFGIFMHNAVGKEVEVAKRGTYYIFVHNFTRKIVASDGSLWDGYYDEDWKTWTLFSNPPPFYYVSTALNWFPGRIFDGKSHVLGSWGGCNPSRVDKVRKAEWSQPQQWRLVLGEEPKQVYNRCDPPLQLTVKDNLLHIEKPELVRGDPNSLFIVVKRTVYKDSVQHQLYT